MRDIVGAAGTYLLHELGISAALWAWACGIVGPAMAALILAIVSTKPDAHFTRGAGGYFRAMVKRAQTGELHLDRTLWKLRREKWGGGGEREASDPTFVSPRASSAARGRWRSPEIRG